MSDIDLRTTVLSHVFTMVEIHAACFGAAAWNLGQMKGSLALDTTQGWSAIENGKVIGYILCQVLPEQVEILTFAVHPDAQKRGIGGKLLKKTVETCEAHGNERIFLEVAADNLSTCHLYEKHGFDKYGIRPNYYRRGSDTVEAILYERILS